MRRELTGEEFLEELLAQRFSGTPTGAGIVRDLFREVPLDFPVIVVDRLPFDLQRRRMIGLTFHGRVWILRSYLDRPGVALLTLLRHEAEHVLQQRASPILFYPRYGLSWICNLVSALTDRRERRERGRGGLLHKAYREILDERRAYTAGHRFRTELIRRLGHLGLSPQNF